MEGYVGEIRTFAGSFAPVGWAFCQGQPLPISQNDLLFSIIGTTYGGDGVSTFNVPDLVGRIPVGTGAGGLLPVVALGAKSGAETVTLTSLNLPVHTHAATFTGTAATPGTYAPKLLASNKAATTQIPGVNGAQTLAAPNFVLDDGSGTLVTTLINGYGTGTADNTLGGFAATLAGGGSATVINASSGGGGSISTLQPFAVLNYIICVQGIYPSRN